MHFQLADRDRLVSYSNINVDLSHWFRAGCSPGGLCNSVRYTDPPLSFLFSIFADLFNYFSIYIN